MTTEILVARARLLLATRVFFAERGFTEVQTPLASAEVIPETHIEPVRTSDGLFLQASPEMHMKRLLCGGSGPIFQLGKAFRDGEHGRLHRREFTLLEWYRPGDDMRAGIRLLDEFIRAVLRTPPCEQTSYRDAFWRACRVDPFNSDLRHLASMCGTGAAAQRLGRDEVLNLLLAGRVEATLGRGAPEVLYHYPESQAALAATTTDALGLCVAERFELYHRGVELANGYHELTDATVLRARLQETNRARVDRGRDALPLPEALLCDMQQQGLPRCAGVALGFDRLVMLATGAESIGAVIA